MAFRPSMARLLLGARVQAELDAMHAVDAAAHRASAGGLAKRQERAAREACRPSPAPIEVAPIDPPQPRRSKAA